MKPKSHKIFIKPTAEQLGVSEVLVTDAVGFYYSELRKALTDMVSLNVKIDSLGTFKIKEKELTKLKVKLTDHLKALDNPESFSQMRVKKEIEKKYEKVCKAYDMALSEKERKEEHKIKKHEYNKRHLEE